MRRHLPHTICAALMLTGGLARAQATATPCQADRAADERAIREMSQRYGRVRDVQAEMEEFSDDVWFFSPLRPEPTRGRAERQRAVEGRRAAAPGDSTVRETTGVMISACGDMAVEHGRFVTRWQSPTGPDSTVGHYLMTFRKDAGSWKITAASVHRSAGTVPATPAVAAAPAVAAPAAAAHARVLPPESGTRLIFCNAPGLSVDVRLDSVTAPGAPAAMGTAELAAGASNVGTHRDADEMLYFLTTGGRAFVAGDTVDVQPGLMMYVPRGVPHGFWSPPRSPIRFVWANQPQSFTRLFRTRGVAPGTPCPPPATR